MADWIHDLATIVGIAGILFVPLGIWFHWVGRHRYEARTDRVFINGIAHLIYVRDVCTHCGHTVERVDRMEQIAKLRLELGVDAKEGAHG